MVRFNKKSISITILCVSLLQMGMVVLSPVLSSIAQVFPQVPQVAIQTAATFLNLILVITALFSGKITQLIGRKYTICLGMVLFLLVAFCGQFFTVNIGMVYLWSGLLGLGTGLFVPSASSMILDCFDGQERTTLAGRQTAAVNLGGVMLSLLSGLLARHIWNQAYLSFLLALPILILCLVALPKETSKRKKPVTVTNHTKSKGLLPKSVWLCTLQAVLFGIVYFTFSTNAALLLSQRGWNNTTISGLYSAVFMLGGGIFGFCFDRIYALLKERTAVGAFLLVSFSFLGTGLISSLPVMMVCAFFGGGSLSMVFPYYLLRIGRATTPENSVLATSMIMSVGPNLGSFLSPIIITSLASLIPNAQPSARFLVAAALAVIIGIVICFAETPRKKQTVG
jgi:MFS family permease